MREPQARSVVQAQMMVTLTLLTINLLEADHHQEAAPNPLEEGHHLMTARPKLVEPLLQEEEGERILAAPPW